MSSSGVSSAKTKLMYAVEAVAGTRPTSGYVRINNCRGIPATEAAPNNLDDTTLDNEEYRSYIAGLKDLGGALGLTFLNNSETRTQIATCVQAFQTAKANGLAMWFCYVLPDGAAFYFTGEPAPLGFGGADVDSVLEVTFYIVPGKIENYDNVPVSLTATPSSVSAVVGTNSTITLSNRVGTASVTSSNIAVATAEAAGNTVTVTPVAAGTCVLTISDAGSGESIAVLVTVTSE